MEELHIVTKRLKTVHDGYEQDCKAQVKNPNGKEGELFKILCDINKRNWKLLALNETSLRRKMTLLKSMLEETLLPPSVQR